jgi:predicted RNA binding protein YcfA (HicA-like mRNA interferase family)
MTNPARILEKLRAVPAELSSDDLQVLLSDLGWKLREGKGSHLVARSPRGFNIVIPTHRKKVAREYLRQILKEIERSGGE